MLVLICCCVFVLVLNDACSMMAMWCAFSGGNTHVIVFIVLFTVPFCLVLLSGSMRLHKGSLSVYRFLLACVFPLPALVHWSITAMWGNSRNERPLHPSDVHLTESMEKV